MSCNLTTVSIPQGGTFEVLASIPMNFPDGHFAAYATQSQLRSLAGGLISTLQLSWADPLTTRVLKLRSNDTATWPIGMAQFDILFTSPTGDRTYTSKQPVLVTKPGTLA